MRMLVEDTGSIITLLVLALLAALLLREKLPWTWPRSLVPLGVVALVGSVVAIAGHGSSNLLRFFGSDRRVVVAVLFAAVAVVLAFKAAGSTWVRGLWFGGCVLLIGWTTLPSESGPPSLTPYPRGALVACVDDPEHWLPPGLSHVAASQLLSEFVPNIALFVPLGVGLLLLLSDRYRRPLKRKRSLAVLVLVPMLVSCCIETYQALFTTRVCAPVDVMANTTGGILGGLLLVGVLAVLRAEHRG